MQTIYILDYDTDIFSVLCEWFKLHGFDTIGFSTPEQLMLHLKLSQPDCIIVDCLYGHHLSQTANLCQTIRNVLHYKGKIILTSTSNLSVKDLKECNAAEFVAKPFNLWQFLNVLNAVLSNSAANSIAK